MSSLLVASGTALVSAAAGLRVLGRLPEPASEPGQSWIKPRYASLWGPGVWLVIVPLSITLAAAVASQRPLDVGLAVAWGSLAGWGTVTAWCDARTTYLPNRLVYPLAALIGLGLTTHFVALVGQHDPAARGALAAVACAILAWAFFWVLWRAGVGLGFGDVRLVAVLGLLTGAWSPATWLASLFAGTVLGALFGLAIVLYRRRNPSELGSVFAYGPALITGAWVSTLI